MSISKVIKKYKINEQPNDFSYWQSDQIIQLGYPPNRIAILTTLKDLSFEDCYKARVEVEIQGLHINFIDIENLKKNKRATGRPQDLADAEISEADLTAVSFHLFLTLCSLGLFSAFHIPHSDFPIPNSYCLRLDAFFSYCSLFDLGDNYSTYILLNYGQIIS